MQHWKDLLKKLNFTESETRVYLTSLEIGPAPVQEIAKKIGVSRMTIYSVIDSLQEKGLMSSVQRGKKLLYNAEDPDKLVLFVQKRITGMEETLREVEKTIKELKLIQHGDKPVVKMFQGHEALKVIQEDLLESNPENIDEFVNTDDILSLYSLKDELEPFYSKLSRLKSPKKRRSIILKEDHAKSSEDKNLERHFLHKAEYDFHGDILVYGNKIALSTFKGDQISVLIESPELAKTFRAFFDYALSKKK